MHLGSPTPQTFRSEGVENLKQARNDFQSSASSSLKLLHLGEPSELGTVILPSVTALWAAAGLLHKFLRGGGVLATL